MCKFLFRIWTLRSLRDTFWTPSNQFSSLCLSHKLPWMGTFALLAWPQIPCAALADIHLWMRQPLMCFQHPLIELITGECECTHTMLPGPLKKIFVLFIFQNNTSPSVLRFSLKSKKSIMLLGALDTFFCPCNFFFSIAHVFTIKSNLASLKKKKSRALEYGWHLSLSPWVYLVQQQFGKKKQVRLFSICYLVKFKFLSSWSCPHLFCTL